MLLSFVVVSAAIWTWLILGALRAEAGFTEEWADLFTRCRIAVEQRVYPDVAGLLSVPVDRSSEPSSGYARSWAHPGGQFVLTDTEREDSYGVHRACRVSMLGGRPIAQRKQIQLAGAFLKMELDLSEAGTHGQIASPIAFPAVFEMFGALKPNSAGCEVVAMIGMSNEGFSANTTVAERGDQCRGTALGPPGQNAI